MFWTVGGSWRTWREPTQVQREHANAKQKAHLAAQWIHIQDLLNVLHPLVLTMPSIKHKPIFRKGSAMANYAHTRQLSCHT